MKIPYSNISGKFFLVTGWVLEAAAEVHFCTEGDSEDICS